MGVCDGPEDATKPECADCVACHYGHEPHHSPVPHYSPGPHFSPGPHYSPDPVDCRHVPDLCTDVCVNFAYCADPMAQDDNCANAPPECGPVCEPYIQCIGEDYPADHTYHFPPEKCEKDPFDEGWMKVMSCTADGELSRATFADPECTIEIDHDHDHEFDPVCEPTPTLVNAFGGPETIGHLIENLQGNPGPVARESDV